MLDLVNAFCAGFSLGMVILGISHRMFRFAVFNGAAVGLNVLVLCL